MDAARIFASSIDHEIRYDNRKIHFNSKEFPIVADDLRPRKREDERRTTRWRGIGVKPPQDEPPSPDAGIVDAWLLSLALSDLGC